MASFASIVWDKLSRIDVAPHVEHINIGGSRSLSYVPWHKAWLLLKREFPASTYTHGEDIVHADGTMEVEVTVTIVCSATGESLTTYARLPVMDNKYKAIPNPNARDINDNRQRCLVKALAFCGLGLSLWDAGSTTPVGTLSDPITAGQRSTLMKLISSSDTDLDSFYAWAGIEEVGELPQEMFNAAKALLETKLARKQK